MNDSEFSPQEQQLIKRLTNAPQPSLNSDAFKSIRARMLDAMDTPPLGANPHLPTQPVAPPIALMSVLTVIVIAVIGITTLIINRTQDSALPIVIPTSMTTFPTILPTVTPQAEVVVPVEVTAIPVATHAPLEIATQPVVSTAPPVSTVPSTVIVIETPLEITSTPILESIIVIEGPVQSVNNNTITIYGIDIPIDPDNPLLEVIQVGDVLRVEVNYGVDTSLLIAVTVEPVSSDINVHPGTGESWRDNGNCSNPPPSWAPANGWRRRCQAPSNNNSSGGGNPGNANPGNSNSGNGNPGSGNPGNANPGNSNSGNGKGRGGNN